MGDPYGPILTGIGMLESGKLTSAGKAGYVADVLGLIAQGNANGKCPGCSPGTQLFAGLIGGLPPVAGPNIINPTTLKSEPLFWWDPDPVAALMSTLLVNDQKTPIWNTIFPEGILTTTAEALDLMGNTPLFPFFDASIPALGVKGFPLSLPDLAIGLGIPPIKLPPLLLSLGIQLQLPSLPSIPTLTLPSFGFPPSLALKAAITIPNLVLGLIALPFKLIIKLLLPPNLSLVLKLLTLDISAVFNLALNLLIELLVDLDLLLITPKLLIASLLIYLKDIVCMVCVDLVGQLVGSGGSLTKLIGTGTGLIAPPPSGS